MNSKNVTNDHYFSSYPKAKPKFGMIYTSIRGTSFRFLTASSVFSKKKVDFGTRLLIEEMILPETGSILDVGCGYGAVGIAVSALNPKFRVFMTDVNTRALSLTKKNIKINNVSNIEVRRGPLYEPVIGLSFNCILSNPPVSAGMKTIKNLIVEAKSVMAEKATLQMVIKSKIAGERLTSIFKANYSDFKVLARKKGYRVLMATKQSLSKNNG